MKPKDGNENPDAPAPPQGNAQQQQPEDPTVPRGRAMAPAGGDGPMQAFGPEDPTLARRGANRVPESVPATAEASRAPSNQGSSHQGQPLEPVAPAGSETVELRSTLDRYQLGDDLGRGGMGVVKLAEDPALRRKVAVKLLLTPSDEAARHAFLDEAQITGQLEHPNIVPVHELGRDHQGRPFLAMKRIGGRTLQKLVERRREQARRWYYDAGEFLDIFGKVCDAVAYAHARGVIHRDLKPENIMVGEYGEVLLMDWGLAKPVHGKEKTSSHVGTAQRDQMPLMTMRGEVLGTPSYMAPEQANGEIEAINERTDVFALGAILYTLLTLQPPYGGKGGETAEQVLDQAARHDLVPPRQRATLRRGIPRELEAIVLKAMAAKPQDRYASATELKADVRAHLSSMPLLARRDPPWTRVIKWGRRHPLTTMATTMSVFFGLVVAVLGLQWHAATERAEREATERALAEAQRGEAEQEAKRLAAEQAKSELEVERQRMLAEQRRQEFEDLGERISYLLSERSQQAIEEFQERRSEAIAQGMVERDIQREFTREEVYAYLQGYKELFDVLEQLEQRPTSQQYRERAMLHMYVREHQYALESISGAIEVEQGTEELADLYAYRGLLYQNQHRHEEAIKNLDRALEMDPSLQHVYINRAISKERLGDIDGAIEDLSTLIELADHHHAYSNRGILRWVFHGDLHGAMRDFDRALERRPLFIDGRRARVEAAFELGAWERVIDDTTTLIERGIDQGFTWPQTYFRGWARLQIGYDREAAIRDLQQAYELSRGGPFRDSIARILREFCAELLD